jgi:hypothetical protein
VSPPLVSPPLISAPAISAPRPPSPHGRTAPTREPALGATVAPPPVPRATVTPLSPDRYKLQVTHQRRDAREDAARQRHAQPCHPDG